MNYLDGFVAAVPLPNKEAFLKHAQDAAVVFKEYGALHVVESWGDDVPEGKLTSFPLAVKREGARPWCFRGYSGHPKRRETALGKRSWLIRA